MERPASQASPSDVAGVGGIGLRELWRLMNAAHPVNPGAARLACGVLVVAYLVLGVARHDAGHPEFDWVRGAVCLWGAVGVWAAGRSDRLDIRLYTSVLALLMSLGAGFIHARLGNPAAVLPITALATFIPLIFLQSARDLVWVDLVLAAGHSFLLRAYPPTLESEVTVAVMVGGSLAAGSAGGFIVLAYRALLQRSTQWWQEACTRERALREFAEVTTGASEEHGLLAVLAERFRAAFHDARCAIVVRDVDGDTFRIAAMAGVPDAIVRRVAGETLSPDLVARLQELARSRQPYVQASITQEQERRMFDDGMLRRPTRSFVALPITADGLLAGAVILTDHEPHEVSPDAIALWQAMASQAGAALARARLVSRLKRLVGELEDARARAEEASRAKSRFLANTSHEIRTPMNGVLGALELLLGAPLGEEAREYAETAKASAESLLSILNDILDFSKMEAGKLLLESLDFSLAAVVEEALAIAGPLARARGLRAHASIDGDVPDALRGDALRLRQVLLNLLANAIKFTHEGEVSVRARCVAEEAGHVTVEIAVADTGIGIEKDRLPCIFESFSQADGSTTRRYGGTGLGLAICRQLTALMGGRIAVESEAGRGSTFRFTVRLARGQKREATPAVSGAPETLRPGDGLHVLVAEDNAVNQLVVVRMLERLGCRVDVASNGREAVASARRTAYDLILMDQHMPELDGVQATLEIRRSENGHRVPLFALTASALPEDRARCLAAGMDGFLPKPLQMSVLRETLDGIPRRADRAERGTPGP